MRTGSGRRTTEMRLKGITTKWKSTIDIFQKKLLRKVCDASKQGLGAVSQQNEENNWKPIAYASILSTDMTQSIQLIT